MFVNLLLCNILHWNDYFTKTCPRSIIKLLSTLFLINILCIKKDMVNTGIFYSLKEYVICKLVVSFCKGITQATHKHWDKSSCKPVVSVKCTINQGSHNYKNFFFFLCIAGSHSGGPRHDSITPEKVIYTGFSKDFPPLTSNFWSSHQLTLFTRLWWRVLMVIIITHWHFFIFWLYHLFIKLQKNS